jgi:hypothetical protein
MKQNPTNYILLSIVIVCSFLSIYTFDFYPDEPYDKSLDTFRLLTPGVLFSFFIVIITRTGLAILRLIFLFFILLTLYSISLIAGLTSWGIAVPFTGGISALLIRKLFQRNGKLLHAIGKDYLVFGFATGLFGLFLFFVLQYALQKYWTVGVGFGFILATWQIVFGTLWIKDQRMIQDGTYKTVDTNGLQHVYKTCRHILLINYILKYRHVLYTKVGGNSAWTGTDTMKENQIEISRKALYYPIVGLVSILGAYLFGTFSTGLNVHSGEIFIYILILFTLGLVIPLICFVKSLQIVRFKLGVEKSKIKTYSIILTYTLGTLLAGLLIFILRTILK